MMSVGISNWGHTKKTRFRCYDAFLYIYRLINAMHVVYILIADNLFCFRKCWRKEGNLLFIIFQYERTYFKYTLVKISENVIKLFVVLLKLDLLVLK